MKTGLHLSKLKWNNTEFEVKQGTRSGKTAEAKAIQAKLVKFKLKKYYLKLSLQWVSQKDWEMSVFSRKEFQICQRGIVARIAEASLNPYEVERTPAKPFVKVGPLIQKKPAKETQIFHEVAQILGVNRITAYIIIALKDISKKNGNWDKHLQVSRGIQRSQRDDFERCSSHDFERFGHSTPINLDSVF